MLANLFGQRIKDVRNSIAISQEYLSSLTGIERAQISKIENGNANVTIDTIEKIAEALNIRPSELLDDTYYKKPQVIYEYSVDKLTPFVKWAGGKSQLLKEIKERLPKNYNNYFEPFVGGGALLFNIAPKKAYINDLNEELIFAYESIKHDSTFSQLIAKLEEHENNHSEEYYYQVRALDRTDNFEKMTLIDRAARMIYLNKACFNGLYRVNSKGYFNVPSGKKETVRAFNRESLLNIHNYLASNKIITTSIDFEAAVAKAEPGDFVYFDPPYDTYENQDNFTAYAKNAFGKDEQHRLFNVFDRLAKRGVYVMLSNHNTAFINELYGEYNIQIVAAKRMINSNAAKRGNVEEVIITNY